MHGNRPTTCETSGENRSTGTVSFTLANGTVPERFWTGLDHLPEVVPSGTVRFGTVPCRTVPLRSAIKRAVSTVPLSEVVGMLVWCY